jgi:hypothetical protein
MSLQHISVDLSGVASREIGRHPYPFPDGLKIGGLLDPDGEAHVFEMANPTSAATAIWIFVNKDGCSLGRGRKRRHDQCRGY